MKKAEVINGIIKEKGYTKYLEIGVHGGFNIDQIECEHVEGVDIDASKYKGKHKVTESTSDDFLEKGRTKWDLIFIDGLHHAEQLEKDFINALNRLKKGGCIVIHDIYPTEEAMTVVPRGNQKQWTGDVYKVWDAIASSEYKTELIKDDFGIGIVYPDGDVPIKRSDISFGDYVEKYA